jgi:hypothetical protein
LSLQRREDRRQGILPFVVTLGQREDVTARAGLTLVVETIRAFGVDEAAQEHLPAQERRSEFPPEAKLEALITLIAAGGDRVEDIRILNEDKGLTRLLGGPFPSPDALLDFLGLFHDPDCGQGRPPEKKAYVPPESKPLLGLEAINRALVHKGASPESKVATVDHDGTIIESHKRGLTTAYEGTKGYQPLVAVWAEEQLILADEFRDANVAGGEDPLSSTKRAFQNLPSWVTQRYFRGDSASYYAPLLKHLVDERVGFAISADMTQQLRSACLALPAAEWEELEKREREQVDIAEVEFAPGDWPKTAAPLRYVAIRFTPLQEELFEPRGPKHVAVVSNRTDLTAAELVLWHRGKAGTIEHVHRSMKDELGAGVMPTSKFGANAAWFRINALTFNVLTVLKRHALPERYHLARPKRLRFELFTMPAKLAVHQSKLTVQASAAEQRVQEFVAARQKLLRVLDGPRVQA